MSSDTHAGARDGGVTSEIEIEMDMEDILIACSEVGDVLRSVRRMRVLNVLAESDERKIEKGDLAREIARREVGADTIEEVATQELQRVQIGCHQCHIPKLKDEGVVEWSEDDHNHIVPGPEFERYLSGLHALALSQGLPVESDLGGVGDE